MADGLNGNGSVKREGESPRSLEEMLQNAQESQAQSVEQDFVQANEGVETSVESGAESAEQPEDKAREALEQVGTERNEQPAERERIDQSVQETDAQSQASAAQSTVLKKGVADDIAAVMKLAQPKQVKALVWLALSKGIHHAFSVANGMKDPYMLDKLHDTLVDEMYKVLCEKKELKDCEDEQQTQQ